MLLAGASSVRIVGKSHAASDPEAPTAWCQLSRRSRHVLDYLKSELGCCELPEASNHIESLKQILSKPFLCNMIANLKATRSNHHRKTLVVQKGFDPHTNHTVCPCRVKF